jgi:hypothetical protein
MHSARLSTNIAGRRARDRNARGDQVLVVKASDGIRMKGLDHRLKAGDFLVPLSPQRGSLSTVNGTAVTGCAYSRVEQRRSNHGRQLRTFH